MRKVSQAEWQKAQQYELSWHTERSNCANSYAEETKQYDYAAKMGLNEFRFNLYGAIGWDFGDRSVLDVGGGAYSLLLKSKARKRVVVDPLDYPNWTKVRYEECGIQFLNIPAEEMKFKEVFDIALIYNCLQHVIDPKKIIENTQKYSRLIYLFEWLEISGEGHPHHLLEKEMNEWLRGFGKVEPAIRGKMYYGVFLGDKYGK